MKNVNGLLLCLLLAVSSNLSANIFNFLASESPQATYLKDVNLRVQHPYVALPLPELVANPDNAVQFQDLRGVECYAQPNQLNVCGTGDTISILLFTKSEEPIFDITLTVNFDEGLEYGLFAFVNSGPAILDEINTDNAEAPTFRINELSQAGGGVVVYIGVRAACGLNLDVTNPGISFGLDYQSGSIACSDEIRPETPYGSNVAIPEVVFNGAPNPLTVQIPDINTDACTTIPISQLTQGTGAFGGIVTVDDYGFATGNIVSSVSVDGVAVPAGDIMVDAAGMVTVILDGETNTTYFGGDGILDFGEDSFIEICFQQTEGCFEPVEPSLSVVFACQREFCIGFPDVDEQLTIANIFDFNVPWQVSNVTVLETPSACGTDGDPDPFLVSYDLASATGDYRGELRNLRFFIDRCTSLPPDTIFYSINGGTDTYPLPASRLTINGDPDSPTFGRTTIDLNSSATVSEIPVDPDLPGVGIEDLDGDGKFDDIAGDQTLTVFIGFTPEVDLNDPACGGGGGFCEFTRVFLFGARDCGRQGNFYSNAIPGTNNFTPLSTAGIGGDTTTTPVFSGGFDFGDVGQVTPTNPGPGQPNVSASRNVEFNYNLAPTEALTCASVESRRVLVEYSANNKALVANIALTNPTVTTGTVTLVREEISSPDSLAHFWEFEVDETADLNDLFFVLTADINICAQAIRGNLDIYLLDFCVGCSDAPINRVCENTIVEVDPNDSPNCACDFEALITLDRVTRGFTDRSLATFATPEDRGFTGGGIVNTVDQDTLQVLPGDTIEITSKAVITGADTWNGVDHLDILLRQLDPDGGSNRSVLNHFYDTRNARLMELTVQRPGEADINLGAVNPPGAFPGNEAILIGSGNGADSRDGIVRPQPAFTHPNFRWDHGNSINDQFDDGNNLRILIRNLGDGSINAYDAVLDALGGGWQDTDTLTVRWQVPIIPIPDEVFVSDVGPTEDISGQQVEDVSRITMNVIGRPLINRPTNQLGPNVVAGGLNCVGAPAMQFFEPQPKVESSIDYQPMPGIGGNPGDINGTGCEAFITIDYTVDNPLPAGFLPNEYRPILGLEQFEMDVPSSFIIKDEAATIQLLNVGPATPIPFTTSSADTIITGMDTFLIANPDEVTLTFENPEFSDGTNWSDYLDFPDGDIDITTVGGSLPILGIGLGVFDTLRITIPLERICPIEATTDLNVIGTMAHPYLADYNTSVYVCGRQNRWTSGPCSGNYFPFDRLSEGHPSRFAFDETYDIVNPPVTIASPTTTVATDFIVDAPGTETNTFTLTSPAAVDGGLLAIEVADAVDLQMISGDATVFTEVATTDSSTVYRVDIPALTAGGTFTIDLITDLAFCGNTFVDIAPVLGCGSDDLAVVAALSGADCGARIMYEYISGLAVVDVTFDYSSNQNGCMNQTYNIQYRNTGTSDVEVFTPTIFIPEGITIDAGSWTAETFSPGAGPTAIAAPTENTDETGVYGRAFQWPANFFDAVAGTDVLEEGEIAIISFSGTQTCDFISGLPLAAKLEGSVACVRTLDTDPEVGPPINIVEVPDPTEPAFELSVSDNRVSCSEGASPFTLTALNTGKAPADMTELCFVLPPGLLLTADNVQAVAPVGYDPIISDPVPVGTGGATEICVTGPDGGVEAGGFLCLDILPLVGQIDCGPADIGFCLKRETTSFTCDGVVCDPLQVLAAEAFIPLEIVPGAAVGETSLTASCSAIPGNTDLNVSVELENIGGRYTEDVIIEIFFDIDGSGVVEPEDPLLGTYTESVDLAPNTFQTLSTVFSVPEDQACPVIIKATVPDCECGEFFIPIVPVEPDFLADIGKNLVVCPGDTAVIDGVCGTFDLVLDPVESGTAFQSNDSIVVILNDDFGVNAPVSLTATNNFGNCNMQDFEILITQLETFEFGPYAFDVCAAGCQILDLGIPVELQEDLEISISPATFISDPTSFEPEICDPTSNTVYTIDFMLNGACMATAEMRTTVFEPTVVELVGLTGCSTGFKVSDIVSVTPAGQSGVITASGDGTFEPTTAPPSTNPDFTFPEALLSDGATYVPGPEDLRSGEVTFTVRTENPAGPCGGAFSRETFTILLVDCGQFFWDGGQD